MERREEKGEKEQIGERSEDGKGCIIGEGRGGESTGGRGEGEGRGGERGDVINWEYGEQMKRR